MSPVVKLREWKDAQKRHKLSDKHVLMARELGMNPRKLGKIDNHKQERWKAPLPDFIERLYFKRFKKDAPAVVKPIMELIADRKALKMRKSVLKAQKRKEKAAQLAQSQGRVAGAVGGQVGEQPALPASGNAGILPASGFPPPSPGFCPGGQDARVPGRTIIPCKLAVLVFIENARGEQLLIHRAKAPNLGAWSPIGGKLETAAGESPYECAVRETREEAGFEISADDLHLFGLIAEKSYEGTGHWLMFLFRCKKPIPALPPDIDEGKFGFFSREAMDATSLPETDRAALWPIFDKHREGFVAMRLDCDPSVPLRVVVEEIMDTGRIASAAPPASEKQSTPVPILETTAHNQTT